MLSDGVFQSILLLLLNDRELCPYEDVKPHDDLQTSRDLEGTLLSGNRKWHS